MDEILKKYGVDKSSLPIVAAQSSGQAQKFVKPDNSSFLGNIGNSAVNIVRGGANALGSLASEGIRPIVNTFKNVYQGQETKFTEQARADQLRSINASQAKWDAQFKQGKISKERYKQLSRQNQEEYRKLGAEADAASKDFADPGAAVKDAITAGATPLLFAGGALEGSSALTKAGKFLPQVIPEAMAGTPLALLRRSVATPALYAPALRSALDVPSQVAEGNFKDAAMNAVQSYAPQLLSVGEKVVKGAGKVASKAIYDSQGLFDMVKVKDGKTINAAFKELRQSDPVVAKKVEKVLKQVQDYNLRAFKGDKQGAANAITEYIGKKNLANISFDGFVKEQKKFITADKAAANITKRLKDGETLVDINGKEIPNSLVENLGAVKSSKDEVAQIRNLVKASDGTPEDVTRAIQEYIQMNPGLYRNQQNQRIIDDIINSGKTSDEALDSLKQLKGTTEAFIKDAAGNIRPVQFPNGYHLGVRNTQGIRFQDATGLPKLEQGNKAIFSKVGDALRKSGVSTEEQVGQARIYKQIRDNFAQKVESVNRPGMEPLSGSQIFSKLEDASSRPGVTDIRQLKVSEISNALGTTQNDSKNILAALKQSFLDIPVKDRGLASKITDLNLAKNPLAAPYSRAQGVLRYEKNPFFGLQETIETKLGVKGLTGASPKFGKDYTETINVLKGEGILTNGYAGEASGEGIARISAKLRPNQEKTLAAGFEALAEQTGESVRQFISNPKNASLVDNMKAIVQYPEKGLTSSNFMKALNLALFPTRYNIKVSQLAYKALRSRPGVEQIAIIKGLNDYNSFLKSDEGIKWQADNSEAIGLIRYFTPVGSVESVMRMLSGKTRSLRDIGSIGGLPFGVISQVLQGQGVIKADTPYLDPKTGEVVPDKLPVDLKARVEKALTDIVGTLYIYPGRLAGGKDVASKGEVSGNIVSLATLGALKGGKYESSTRTDLTDEQRNIQRVLGTKNSSSSNNTPYSVNRVNIPKAGPANLTATSRIRSTKTKKKAVKIGQPF